MDGVNGAILDLKDRRDHEAHRKVPLWTKTLSWAFLALVAIGILFYIYLFAMRQTVSRQTAWFKSFVIWIVLEVVLVSSAVVMAQHVLLPMVTSAQVRKIKDRVARDIVSFNAKVRRARGAYIAKYKERSFNAAAYLFPSHKLASLNPKLPESSVITRYHTVYPKRAFQDPTVHNVKNNYDSRFAYVKQVIPRIAIFLLSSIIQLPPPIQDAISDIASTAAFGYFVMVHVKLYRINPLLAFLPLLTACLLVHFLTVSGKASLRLDQAKTVPVVSDSDNSDCDVEAKNDCPVPNEDIIPPSVVVVGAASDSPTGRGWMSRRASAAEGFVLASSLAKRLEVLSPATSSASARSAAPLQSDWSEASSDSSGSGESTDGVGGEKVLQWEDDGDPLDPDLESNRDIYGGNWGDSDSAETVTGIEAPIAPIEEEGAISFDEDMVKVTIDSYFGRWMSSESDRDNHLNEPHLNSSLVQERVTNDDEACRNKEGEARAVQSTAVSFDSAWDQVERRFGDVENRRAMLKSLRERGIMFLSDDDDLCLDTT